MNELKKFFKGFFYAGRGIVTTVLYERNMRVHLVFVFYMFTILCFTDWFVLSKADWIALIISSAVVISSELVNTAVENAVDMVTNGKKNEFAKRAKDAASGAVLVLAVASVITGIIILFQPLAFSSMYHYFSENIPMFVMFLISIAVSVLFVFKCGRKK